MSGTPTPAGCERVYVTGVGWVPRDALLAALVFGGVNLEELADAPVVDETKDAE